MHKLSRYVLNLVLMLSISLLLLSGSQLPLL
jgi:hypothetical protein